MRWVALRLAALPCVLGCSSPVMLPSSYEVRLDPGLSAEASEAVAAAAQDWVDAAGVRLRVEVGPCNPSVFCIQGGVLEGSTIGRTTDVTETGAIIALDLGKMADNGASVEQTAAHELGHAMQLVHAGPGTLMCGEYHCQAPRPTSTDISAWRAMR